MRFAHAPALRDDACMILGPDGRPAKIDRQYLTHTFQSYRPSELYAWDTERILAARNAHVLGQFSASWPLAVAMWTDPSIFAARLNRLAPALGLPREIVGGASDAVRNEATETFLTGPRAITNGLLSEVFDTNAMMGFMVYQNVWTPREDGSRIDVAIEPWPMAALVWRDYSQELLAQTTDGLVPVVHGDGKWVVVRVRETKPWQSGALVPLAVVWPDGGYGRRDRSRNAEAHGEAKAVGYLPEGVNVAGPEGLAMAAALQKLHAARGLMVAPYGSEVKYLESMNQAWQIFREILTSSRSDAQLIMLGQDGAASSTGGNYVKSSVLFGVRNDIVEGDVGSVGRAIGEGTLGPWEAVNFGAGGDLLSLHWLMPDADEDARRESHAKRTADFNAAVKAYRENGFEISQEFVAALANSFGIEEVPTLAAAASTGFVLAPTDLAKAITANEARASVGLDPREDGDTPLATYGAPATAAAPQEPAAPNP